MWFPQISAVKNEVPASTFLTITNSFITRVCFIYLFATYTYSVSIAIVAYRVGSLGNDSWRRLKVSEFKIFKISKCSFQSVLFKVLFRFLVTIQAPEEQVPSSSTSPPPHSSINPLDNLSPSRRKKCIQVLDRATERHTCALKLVSIVFTKEELSEAGKKSKVLDGLRMDLVKSKEQCTLT